MLRIFLSLLGTLGALAPIAHAQDGNFPWSSERKILGDNNLEPIVNATGTAAFAFSRPIARVETPVALPEGILWAGYCTASRVAPDLFITNFHCDVNCDEMRFTLNYESDVLEADRPHFKCASLIRKNETLDYALYSAEIEVPELEMGIIPILTLYKGPLVDGMKLVVPSHPSNRLKEIDRSDECVLLTQAITHTESGRDTMKHMCDTESGSSGAPLIDSERGYVIGIHWGGEANVANYAISMRMILEDLEANVPAETYEKLTIAE